MSNYAYLSARDTEPAAVRCVNGTRAHDLPPLAAASTDGLGLVEPWLTAALPLSWST